jgi:predicted ATPase
MSLWFLGYPAQAQRRIAQTVALGAELGHPFSHVFALYHDTFLKQQCRRGPDTLKGSQALLELAQEQSFPFWVALGMLTRGTGLLLEGSCDEAINWLRDGLNALRQTGAGIVVPHFTIWLAQAYGKARRFDEAFATLDEASSLVYGCKELFNEAELHRIRGELLLAASGDTNPTAATEAETCFNQAREIAHRQRSRSLELRAATSLAHLLNRQGRCEQALGILAPVYQWFTEGLDTPDLTDARALLDALTEKL